MLMEHRTPQKPAPEDFMDGQDLARIIVDRDGTFGAGLDCMEAFVDWLGLDICCEPKDIITAMQDLRKHYPNLPEAPPLVDDFEDGVFVWLDNELVKNSGPKLIIHDLTPTAYKKILEQERIDGVFTGKKNQEPEFYLHPLPEMSEGNVYDEVVGTFSQLSKESQELLTQQYYEKGLRDSRG